MFLDTKYLKYAAQVMRKRFFFKELLNSIPNERGFKMAFLNIVSLPKGLDELTIPDYQIHLEMCK